MSASFVLRVVVTVCAVACGLGFVVGFALAASRDLYRFLRK